MTSPLHQELDHALGGAYAIERELGGGGMSRVFVATALAHGRQIVVKVLPPDSGGATVPLAPVTINPPDTLIPEGDPNTDTLLVIYGSHPAFQQTTTLSGSIGEGTGGMVSANVLSAQP